MPHIATALNNVEDTVSRPICMSITKQLMNYFNISDKTQIYFMGVEEKAQQQNANDADSTEDAPLNRWAADQSVTVSVDEKPMTDFLLVGGRMNRGHMPIFADNTIGVLIKPTYTATEVTISFKYKAQDKAGALRWMRQMQYRAGQSQNTFLHRVQYAYTIPASDILRLRHLHQLREAQGGYGQTFEEWFTQNVTDKASVIADLAGANRVWAISEKAIRLQGYCDFEGVPNEPSKENDHGNHSVEFTYTFRYMCPTMTYMAFPLMVHQQLVDSALLPQQLDLEENHPRYASMDIAAFSSNETDQEMLRLKSNMGMSVPSFDDFMPTRVLTSSIKVYTALCSISQGDKRSLMNLCDLDGFTTHPIAKTLLQSEQPWLGTDFESIFCLSLYVDRELYKTMSVACDTQLNVSSLKDLSIRNVHRVRLGLITNMSLLSAAALARLQSYPLEYLFLLIKTINAALNRLSSDADILKNKLSIMDLGLLGIDIDMLRELSLDDTFLDKVGYTRQDFLDLIPGASIGLTGITRNRSAHPRSVQIFDLMVKKQ